jgi:octaprenyl-diphosphate synthase
MTQEDIFGLVSEKLDRVQRRFADGLGSNVEIVASMGDYVSNSGGKRLRPALLLLSSGLVGYEGPDDVLLGAAFELIHTATLVHDDIIDEAATRRGRESLNHRWGNHLTVLMGDHLYLRAMQLAIGAGHLDILDVLADTTLRMIEGEMIQGEQGGRIDVTENEHLDVVERKTAILFAACCRVPAMLAQCTPEQERALEMYGFDLGMAFQLVDDLLDFTADERVLGKPTVNDLREGKLTLPLIYLLAKGNRSHRELVRTVMEDRGFTRVPREQILALLVEHGCLEAGRAKAAGYVERARGHLRHFPDSRYKDALLAALGFVMERDR